MGIQFHINTTTHTNDTTTSLSTVKKLTPSNIRFLLSQGLRVKQQHGSYTKRKTTNRVRQFH